MPDTFSRRSFLAEVGTHLGLDPDAEADVLDELAAHLDDSMSFHEAEGLQRRAAEQEAVRRLGDPIKLARQIRKAHQTRRRLLAAIGGGVLGAADGAVRGMVPAIGVWIGASLLGMIMASLLAALIGRHLSLGGSSVDPATGYLLATSVAFGAARRGVWAVARAAHLPLGRSSAGVGITGVVAIGAWCLFGPPVVMHPGTIVAEAALVLAWTAGVISIGRFPDLAVTYERLVIASVIPGLLLGVLLLLSPSSSGAEWYDGPPADLSRAGSSVASDQGWHNVAANPQPKEAGRYDVLLGPLPKGATSVRIEVWAALRRDVQSPFADDIVGELDPAALGPVRAVPLVADGTRWIGSIRFDDIRDLNQAWVVTTAELDGRRIVFQSAPTLAVYRGNLADWLGSFAPGSVHAVPHA
jgi:hypothetical protein